MSLLGLDVGTTGCKAVVFSAEGAVLTQTYREYDLIRIKPGWSEFNSLEVWEKVKDVIRIVASETAADAASKQAASPFGLLCVNLASVGPPLILMMYSHGSSSGLTF